ncbi:MAG TPA: oligopeptide/dipeptide ABC transporter ATP-binding protein, partial [Kribbella sp.]
MPDPDTVDSRERIILVGDIPSPTHPPSGCRFHTRCPKAQDECVRIDPPLLPVLGDADSHRTACLFPLQVGEDLSTAVPQIADSEIRRTPITGT